MYFKGGFMKRVINLIIVFIAVLSPSVFAETLKVGLEPMPPLIIDENKGYSIELLKNIEKISDIRFDITIMPYNRAKYELKRGRLDLIGHTPFKKETQDFYNYAVDINWSIPTVTDIYAKNDKHLYDFNKLNKIGAPIGNKNFYSDLFNIDPALFYETDLIELLRLLYTGVLTALIFERSSVMTSIKNLGIKNIHYRMIDNGISAGFAVRNDFNGKILKKKLEDILGKLNIDLIYSDYQKYVELPEKGIVSY